MRFNIIIFSLFMLSEAICLQAQPYGLTERVPNTSFLISASGSELTAMDIKRTFENLSFDKPLYLTHAGDGTDRLFIVEKAGVVKVIENDAATAEVEVFLDISEKVNAGYSESGLLSIAFHPDYETNGTFYIYYMYGELFSRVSEYKVSSDRDRADANSERVLLDLRQPVSNHNGGLLLFGPDGKLYIGLGDGGGGGDPHGNGQNPTTLFGSILRIDVDQVDSGLQYAIPEDNPFKGNQNGWREEIWAWGMRNPWRFSFDRTTGVLWAADVGQYEWEEINIVEKGGNYGWNIMEGTHCFRASSCDTTGLILPVFEYGHDVGRSITGGFVYRGARLVRLFGVYIYGDYATRKIWGLKYRNGMVEENALLAACPSAIASFGETESGEIFIVGLDGKIYMLEEKSSTPPTGRIPETISESGLFSDAANQIIAPGIIPYSVNVPFWSDGAEKTRYIALPYTSQITFSEYGHWDFPPDAVTVKNFYLELEKGNPESRKIIETRFLVKRIEDEGWDGFSYQWNDSSTDAVLLNGSDSRTFTITDTSAPGGQTEQTWYFPSRSECNVCHTPAAGYALGVRTAQINKQHWYGDVMDNQLRSYNHIQLFDTDIGEDYTAFPRLQFPFDEESDLDARARSYLDVNCANCHRPGGTGRSGIDMRYESSLSSTNMIMVPPELGDLAISGVSLINPGTPDSSIIYLRMLDEGAFRMPPLASIVIDRQGAELIRQWIVSLEDVYQDSGSNGWLSRPEDFVLFNAYPNPFNPVTTIRYHVPVCSHVSVSIYNMSGQNVRTLARGMVTAGDHIVQWNGRDNSGTSMSTGVYMVHMTADNYRYTRKLVMLK
ncbi:MAG: PQQ-dependent sugar dehydrogenase [candidate division KSB1 bacterium]|nr:PQQ-dependent sugar dehydrogenase [candidate division KSB1 bacterium]